MFKQGHSLCVVIPIDFVKRMGVKAGDKVDLHAVPEGYVFIRRSQEELEEQK